MGDGKAAGVAVSQVSLRVISGSEGKDSQANRERRRKTEREAIFIG